MGEVRTSCSCYYPDKSIITYDLNPNKAFTSWFSSSNPWKGYSLYDLVSKEKSLGVKRVCVGWVWGGPHEWFTFLFARNRRCHERPLVKSVTLLKGRSSVSSFLQATGCVCKGVAVGEAVEERTSLRGSCGVFKVNYYRLFLWHNIPKGSDSWLIFETKILMGYIICFPSSFLFSFVEIQFEPLIDFLCLALSRPLGSDTAWDYTNAYFAWLRNVEHTRMHALGTRTPHTAWTCP